MGKISQLEPKEVFHFFEEICQIPHGSGNVEQISDYLVDFAKARNLEYVQDELKNVVIIKEASAGYEAQEPILLQGHMDMVAVKKPGCTRDMTKEGLDLEVDGDYLLARDTTLGGDDGIAVAYAPVSYTHLDVYKRQAPCSAWRRRWGLRCPAAHWHRPPCGISFPWQGGRGGKSWSLWKKISGRIKY